MEMSNKADGPHGLIIGQFELMMKIIIDQHSHSYSFVSSLSFRWANDRTKPEADAAKFRDIVHLLDFQNPMSTLFSRPTSPQAGP
jgi:hypothetical protein